MAAHPPIADMPLPRSKRRLVPEGDERHRSNSTLGWHRSYNSMQRTFAIWRSASVFGRRRMRYQQRRYRRFINGPLGTPLSERHRTDNDHSDRHNSVHPSCLRSSADHDSDLFQLRLHPTTPTMRVCTSLSELSPNFGDGAGSRGFHRIQMRSKPALSRR
jgi:hypothetical protein